MPVAESELADTVSDPSTRQYMVDYRKIALTPDAIEQPADVDVNEIIVRPTAGAQRIVHRAPPLILGKLSSRATCRRCLKRDMDERPAQGNKKSTTRPRRPICDHAAMPPEEFRRLHLRSLLGRAQTIQKGFHGTFLLTRDHIQNVFHLVDQRVHQQNDATLIQFTVTIRYGDDSSVMLNDLADFLHYNEVHPLVFGRRRSELDIFDPLSRQEASRKANHRTWLALKARGLSRGPHRLNS